jgi:hypothetical protein
MKPSAIALLILASTAALHAETQPEGRDRKGAGSAQAETAVQRGKRVVNEALEALGGDRFLAMQDRVEEGRAYSFYRRRLTGLSQARIYTRYLRAAAPGELGQRERQVFGKDDTYYLLWLENKAYSVTYRGAAPLPQERFDRYARSTRHDILYILHNRLKEPGLIIEGRGTEVWQNTPVEIVDITDADNQVVRVYFHRTTKLPVRSSWVARDPKTKERDEFVTIFSKFRDVGGGVMWPFNIMSERNGEKVFELYSESVTINTDLTDDLFVLSAKTPILDEEK